MKNFLSALLVFVSVSTLGATLWTQDGASVSSAVMTKVTTPATTPTATTSSSVRNGSITEIHRVVTLYNSRSEIVGTKYVTETRDRSTGKETYSSVSYLEEVPTQPRVVFVPVCRPCPPAPCYQGGSWGSVFPDNVYSSSVGSCNVYSGSTGACSVRSGSVAFCSAQSVSIGSVSTHGGNVYSGSQFAGGFSAGQTFSGGTANGSSYSSSGFSAGAVYGGSVYPGSVGYVTERNYSWGAGVTVGGGVSSGLSQGPGSSHGGSFSGGSVSSGSVSSGSTGGGRRH